MQENLLFDTALYSYVKCESTQGDKIYVEM